MLELVQNICPRLFEKRAPLLSELDRIDQRYVARDVGHFADNFQRRIFPAQRIEIEADGLGQLQLRDSIVVLRGDQLRNLIVESDFRLQDIEPRNRSRFEAVLLILQLALQQSAPIAPALR